MATAASKAADSYIGSLICLVTKSDIRYEGSLFHLDAQQSSIALRNVKSFGTEGRKKDGPQIPSSDRIYEYICFRGSDIKDLQVRSSPPPHSMPAVPDDPAIIQSHFPTNPTTVGMASPGAAQVASSSVPSIHPVAPFQMNLPPNRLPPSSSPWGSSFPPPPVNINGPALPYNWPVLVGSSGGVSHFQQRRFPPPPQSLVASLQQQGQHQNVNASLAGGSSQRHPLLLPITAASPNLLPVMPSPPPGLFNPGQPARPVFSLSSIPMPNASHTLPTVEVDSGPKMVSSLEAELNVSAMRDPVTKAPSSMISTSDSFPTISQTVLSTVDSKDAPPSNLSKLPLLTPGVLSEVKYSSSSRLLHTDVQAAQASVSEPLPSQSTKETEESFSKSTTAKLHGSTPSHQNISHLTRGRDEAHREYRDTSIHHDNRGSTHGGIPPNGASVCKHRIYGNHASGRAKGLIGPAPYPRQSYTGMGRGSVPNDFPQHNHRNGGSQFWGCGAKNSYVVKRYSEDFDFEAMNEKFNKKEVWDALGKSNNAESDDEIGDEKEMNDSDAKDEAGDGNAIHDYRPVYCKDDFFDSLSLDCQKVRMSEQRKKDVETFGETQKHSRGRGLGAHMSWASQGSHRGRGYDNARGGRGQGRTVWSRVT